MKEMIYENRQRQPKDILDRGEYKGYEYIILSLHTHPCAYVCLTKDSMFYKKNYDEIDIECHGGLTFSEDTLRNIANNETIKRDWIIGWDYAHYGDYHSMMPNNQDKKWTTQEIQQECKSVINQIITYELKQTRNKLIKEIKEELEYYANSQGETPRKYNNIDELHDDILQYGIDGVIIEDDDELYELIVKVLEVFGAEILKETNDFIDEEFCSYYLDPAFSSPSDYWNYRLG